MSWDERVEAAAVAMAASAMMASVGAAAWVVRRVFTNQKQIEMLQREIESRDKQRTEDRAQLGEVRTDVREMRSEIRQMIRRG